jgi:hypothetical protein
LIGLGFFVEHLAHHRHKTNSMYRRYRIVDEDELRQAQEQQQAFLKNQTAARKVVPLRTGT